MVGSFRCIGGIDVDAAAIRDFGRFAGVPGTVLDLFDRDQYRDFHGCEPSAGWREATAADIQTAAGHERPHIVFLSPPCKGLSGLLSEAKSKTAKYQALNKLTVRGIWLTLEAFADDPPELLVLENVPRIQTRGRHLLDQINGLLRSYGYEVAETTHDCGRLGGLAQTRRRFLMVARHRQKVPPFLYEPPKRPLRAVGDVLGRMPLPGDLLRAGPMHRLPALQWQTWVRLAFVEAGSDWRSLSRLNVVDGQLTDFRIAPAEPWHNGALGVTPWGTPRGTITANGRPAAGRFSVADPRRAEGVAAFGQYGVNEWGATMQSVIGKAAVSAGNFSVADPRHGGPAKFSNVYNVVEWDQHAGAVTSSRDVAIADPRAQAAMFHNAYKLTAWSAPAQTITGQHTPSDGAGSVADPRPGLQRSKGDDWAGAGHYGIVPWSEHAGAVSSAAGYDNGRWSVADPREPSLPPTDASGTLPAAQDRLVARIRSLDGTWHRPFTTLELAALQSLVDPEEHLELEGLSDATWRERIGNAVPPAAATAIADTMGRTLLLAWSSESFMLSAVPIWVRPLAIGLAVQQGEGVP